LAELLRPASRREIAAQVRSIHGRLTRRSAGCWRRKSGP
jgi:hypothetical protein